VDILSNAPLRRQILKAINSKLDHFKINKDEEITHLINSFLALKVPQKKEETKRKLPKKNDNDSPVYIQLTFSKNMSEITSKITSEIVPESAKKFCNSIVLL
jgi:hypothetical protein